MAKTLRKAGQVNMRGKKEAVMGCECCVCRDLREDILSRVAKRETAMEIVDPTHIDDGSIHDIEPC